HQRKFGGRRQEGGVGLRDAGLVGARLGDHRAYAGVRILDVVHRVFVALGQREVDIEHEFGIGPALDQEVSHRIAAHPVDQVAQGDVTAGAFGDLDLFAAARHLYHLVQHVRGVIGGDAGAQRLQAGPHARHGTVVVAALDVHGAVKAAFPFGLVVGDVGHEVRVTAFAFAHDAVFVVAGAEFGCAQPERAVLLVRVA